VRAVGVAVSVAFAVAEHHERVADGRGDAVDPPIDKRDADTPSDLRAARGLRKRSRVGLREWRPPLPLDRPR